MPSNSGIYKITNTVNGKIYIGQSRDLKQRRQDEILKQRVNRHLKNSFKKYGVDKFQIEILAECDIEQLDELEKHFIAEYDSTNPMIGYNKTYGGRHKYKFSPEARQDMSGPNNPFYGKKHTPETIRRLSEIASITHKGRRHSEKTKRKQAKSKIGSNNPMAKQVFQYTKDGKLVEKFGSVSISAEKTGFGYSAIKNCAGGLSRTAFGFVWSYGSFPKDRDFTDKKLRPVRCVETGEVFPSVAEASRATGIPALRIHKSCYRKSAKYRYAKLQWEYMPREQDARVHR